MNQQQTFFAVVRRCEDGGWIGTVHDAYSDERERDLAWLGGNVIGEFATGTEARQAMHNCIVVRTAALNAAHVRPRQSRKRRPGMNI
jgi:hypothetical protein